MPLLPTLLQTVRKTDFQSALTVTLGQVCELADWDYGEVWIPNDEGTLLQISPASYINTHRFKASVSALEQFWLCSQSFIITPGVGLPGRVWLSHQPQWIYDVSAQSETYFLRHYIAKAFGIKTGFGVPIVAENRVIAVLVFFMLTVRLKDRRLIQLVTAAASQLGAVCSVGVI